MLWLVASLNPPHPDLTMPFSPEWDALFRAGRNVGEWPWSDVVSLVYRYAKPSDGYRRVLELGPGNGANIPLFLALGAEYHAVEGSAFVVAHLHERFPQLAEHIVAGDFTREIPFTGPFDLVVDRASITHNTTEAIRRTLALMRNVLRPGGKMIGVDWFAADHSAASTGTSLDSHTRISCHGTFEGVGAVHFSDRSHLLELLAGAELSIEYLAHKQVTSVDERMCSWNFVSASI
jgi:SAM-dependent methyltransferase